MSQEQSQSGAIRDLVCASGLLDHSTCNAVAVVDRVHVLNRLATLSGPSTSAANAARAYLRRRNELFEALMSGGGAQQDRCRLVISPLEREICQRPSLSEPVHIGQVSSAKLEFLLSHHCAGQTEAIETSPPWGNWNDLTFCFVHALRSSMRGMCGHLHAIVADTQCVALLSAYSSFLSLPVLTSVMQWSLLALLEPSSSGEHTSPSSREEPQELVLHKYFCAALALLENPQIPLEQTVQALCGAFYGPIVKKLWQLFVSDTEPFKGTFLPILDRAVALLMSKKTSREGDVALVVCAPLLFLSTTAAKYLLETASLAEPMAELCRRLQANCCSAIASTARASGEHKFTIPLSMVYEESNESSYLVGFDTALYRVTHQVTVKESCAEVLVSVGGQEHGASTDASSCSLMSFSSLMSFTLGESLSSDVRASGQSNHGGVVDNKVPPDAEFDTQMSSAVWGPALRGSSDAWTQGDFTFVRLLEEICEEEFLGDSR